MSEARRIQRQVLAHSAIANNPNAKALRRGDTLVLKDGVTKVDRISLAPTGRKRCGGLAAVNRVVAMGHRTESK